MKIYENLTSIVLFCFTEHSQYSQLQIDLLEFLNGMFTVMLLPVTRDLCLQKSLLKYCVLVTKNLFKLF